MRRVTLWALVGLSLWIGPACNSDDDAGSGGGGEEWNATINGQSGNISITSQTATTRADGGVRMDMSGLSFTTDDFDLRVDVSGGLEVDLQPQGDPDVTPSATLQIGLGDINFTMDVGSDRYRGTGGTITFTDYDIVDGGTVAGSFDAQLVTVSGESKAATLQGDFSAAVTEPTPSPTPVP